MIFTRPSLQTEHCSVLDNERCSVSLLPPETRLPIRNGHIRGQAMTTENLSLIGKTALVTGGSRGIGAACAKLLAARGATVVVTYSKSVERADAVVTEIA